MRNKKCKKCKKKKWVGGGGSFNLPYFQKKEKKISTNSNNLQKIIE
jgi:hypothetical protein